MNVMTRLQGVALYKLSEDMETPFPIKIIVYTSRVGGVGAAYIKQMK